jgi:hypothetical protein
MEKNRFEISRLWFPACGSGRKDKTLPWRLPFILPQLHRA